MPIETPTAPKLSPEKIDAEICRHTKYALWGDCEHLTKRGLFWSLALTARGKMVDGMFQTERRYKGDKVKRPHHRQIRTGHLGDTGH